MFRYLREYFTLYRLPNLRGNCHNILQIAIKLTVLLDDDDDDLMFNDASTHRVICV